MELWLETELIITQTDPDQIIAWPRSDALLREIMFRKWIHDPGFASQHHHGSDWAYREPGGVTPNLHVSLYPPEALGHKAKPAEWPWEYYAAIHLDFHAADLKHPDQLIGHGLEVLGNWLTQKKTDQRVMAVLLDHRFGALNSAGLHAELTELGCRPRLRPA